MTGLYLHGWCIKCHRIARVDARLPINGTAIGMCRPCQEKVKK